MKLTSAIWVISLLLWSVMLVMVNSVSKYWNFQGKTLIFYKWQMACLRNVKEDGCSNRWKDENKKVNFSRETNNVGLEMKVNKLIFSIQLFFHLLWIGLVCKQQETFQWQYSSLRRPPSLEAITKIITVFVTCKLRNTLFLRGCQK